MEVLQGQRIATGYFDRSENYFPSLKQEVIHETAHI